MSPSDNEALALSFRKELFENILPYWFRLKTDSGFIAALDNQNRPIPGSPVGLIMVARLLWTYSRAYHLYGDASHLELAEHARTLLLDKFLDREHGGFFWTLDDSGNPLETQKQCYGQAFCIYAFSEHFIATQNADSLELARSLFALLETKAWDANSGGYLETFEPDWTPLENMRLGADDLDAPKTMNNHLHMIEAYANLYRAAPSPVLKASATRMIRIIADRIILPDTPRFGLFYDMDWNLLDPIVSPGHDIEGSWLLWEAAEILGDKPLETEMKALALRMAECVLQTGIDPADHGVYYEFHDENLPCKEKHWWPQAEGVVGFYNAYQLSGDTRFLDAALKTWEFIQSKIIDREYGEWIWGIDENGKRINKEKAGPWKSAYHNGRACFEMLARLK